MHLPNCDNLIIALGDTIQITLDTLIKVSVLKHFRLTIKVSVSAKKKIADIIIFGNKNNYVNLKVHLKIEFSMILLPILYFAF